MISHRNRCQLPSDPQIVVFAAFQFDAEAAKDIDETRWPGLPLLKAQMNAGLLTDDLKKKRASNDGFWMVGQPEVHFARHALILAPGITVRSRLEVLRCSPALTLFAALLLR